MRGLALILSLLAPVALAQPAEAPARFGLPPLWPAPSGEAESAADAAAGRAVAMGAETMAGWACHACHGLHGEGDGSGAFPRLAGQSAWYLYRQLQDYAAGTRAHSPMTPIARAMTDRQMRDVAAWYAAQVAPAAPVPPATTRVVQLGGAIAAVGAPARGVTACIACHGERGEGTPPAIPALAGQYATYTALQLRLWKQGERPPGALGVMATIAAGMSDAEIDAVAAYYARLPPASR